MAPLSRRPSCRMPALLVALPALLPPSPAWCVGGEEGGGCCAGGGEECATGSCEAAAVPASASVHLLDFLGVCLAASGAESAGDRAAARRHHQGTRLHRVRVPGEPAGEDGTGLGDTLSGQDQPHQACWWGEPAGGPSLLIKPLLQKLPNPVVSSDEIPPGAERKNRYSNVLPSESPSCLSSPHAPHPLPPPPHTPPSSPQDQSPTQAAVWPAKLGLCKRQLHPGTMPHPQPVTLAWPWAGVVCLWAWNVSACAHNAASPSPGLQEHGQAVHSHSGAHGQHH